MSALHWIDPLDSEGEFPDVERALTEPDGLLAVGGDLSPKRLLRAYRHGIFPWYNVGQPILWWSPNPRSVLFPEQLKVSRTLRRTLRRQYFQVSFDTAFGAVVEACAAPRRAVEGTWITPAMKRAYHRLYQMGVAHSVEVWRAGRLVGGLYGVALGRVFFGESMFSLLSDASKVALVYLARQLQSWRFTVIDCQVHSAHLESLGARPIPRREFTALLDRWCDLPSPPSPWRLALSQDPSVVGAPDLDAGG